MKPNLHGITILEQVGNGAGSIVFRAKDDRTGEDLAVKSVTPEIVLEIQKRNPSPEYGGNIRKVMQVYLAQIRNEWRLGHWLTKLAGGHVGIPRMHKLEHECGTLMRTRGLHLVMDFVEGENLRMRRDYPLSKMIDIYRQAADILRFMHRNNVVHADMKPQHITVGPDGRVRILDLGLACRREGHMSQVVGSPNYMAPEQLAGAGVDEWTDVFGLGATMFWALTGRSIRPNIGGAAALGAMDRQTRSFETSVREYNPEVPPALEEIILRSCAPSRHARLTLAEVISRLDRLA